MISGDIDVTELTGVINNYTNLEGSMMTAGPKGDKGDKGEKGDTGSQGFSPIATVTKSGKVATVTITDLTGTTTCEIRDGEDGQGSGDMLKATYDTNDNGIVDNAEKVNNHTVLTDVPANAVFTDTTYTAGTNVSISSENVISATDTTYTAGTGIDITNGVISNTQTSAEWGNITGTLSNQTDLNTALSGKQETLVSGTNIKTINSTSLLGSGDITIQGSTEVAISTTTPSGNEVLWINPNEEQTFTGGGNCNFKLLTGSFTVTYDSGEGYGQGYVLLELPEGYTNLNTVVLSASMTSYENYQYALPYIDLNVPPNYSIQEQAGYSIFHSSYDDKNIINVWFTTLHNSWDTKQFNVKVVIAKTTDFN